MKQELKHNYCQKTRWKFSLIVLFTIFCNQLLASNQDTNYIKKTDESLSVSVYTAVNNKQIRVLPYKMEADDKEKIYTSNRGVLLGIGVAYENLSFSFDMAVADDNGEGRRTKSFDFQSTYFLSDFAIDVYAQIDKGFSDISDGENAVVLDRSDISALRLGASSAYILNSDKFSYRSSFKSNEIQQKSAGSFLLGIDFFYNEFRYKNSLWEFDTILNQSIYDFQVGPFGGYAYTFVLNKHLFLTLSSMVGFNVDFAKINTGNYNNISVSPSANGRFSMGYNITSWSVFLSTFVQYFSLGNYTDLNINFLDLNIKLSVVKRFHYKSKLLTKASDLLNF